MIVVLGEVLVGGKAANQDLPLPNSYKALSF